MKQRNNSEGNGKNSRYVLKIFYCEHCGGKIMSYLDDNGVQKVTCERCRLDYVRRKLGRRHMRTDIYIPDFSDEYFAS